MLIPRSFDELCAAFLLFIAYSGLGWCGEMLYCSIPKGRLCEKRGFLNGFLCPIYGHGALLGLGSGVIVPLASFLCGIYLTDTVLSVRSAIQLGNRLEKLHALKEQLSERADELRERIRSLRDGQDIFERRLLRSHPGLRTRHPDLLEAVRRHRWD